MRTIKTKSSENTAIMADVANDWLLYRLASKICKDIEGETSVLVGGKSKSKSWVVECE